MRESYFYPMSNVSILCVIVAVFLSACSTSNDFQATSTKKNSNGSAQNKTSVSVEAESNNKTEHDHPSNPCTVALSHSHAYETKEHEHRYDCESTNKILINGHIHEATEKFRKHRHVHPNGSNEHFHIRG